MPTVYLAGGCYWGVQTYYDRVQGVTSTVAGFAQSRIPRPTGEQIASGEAGAVETVAVAYDSQQVSLQTLARLHALLIQETPADEKTPISEHVGFYWTDSEQRDAFEAAIRERNLADVTIEQLTRFEESSEEQQHYLASHPGAECHIPIALLNEVGKYQKELSI